MKRIISIFIVFFMFFLVCPYDTKAFDAIKVTRLAGQDRFETATKISQYFGREGYYTVLVNSEDYPDAVTVSPLAKKFEAPILLINKDNIPDVVKNELIRLRTRRVFIIGGTSVISENVEKQLTDLGIIVEERIYGEDRFETSTKIAHHLISATKNSVYVVEDEDWRNALAMAPVAGWNQCPIILMGKKRVSSFIIRDICNEFHDYYLIGETGNQNFINNSFYGLTYNGLAINSLGDTKENTNIEIYNTFKKDIHLEKVYLVSSEDIPDAMSLGYLAGLEGSMILFINQNNLSPIENFLYDKAGEIKELVVVGGEGVLPQSHISKLYEKVTEGAVRYENQQISDKGNKKNEIVVEADVSKYRPEIQQIIKEDEKLKQYAIWLTTHGITKEEALKLVRERTDDNNLDILGEGFANDLYKLDTGKDISKRRFYEIYTPNDFNALDYLVDKEDGTIYKEVEGQQNVYTLFQ